jgi:hypothetical protein
MEASPTVHENTTDNSYNGIENAPTVGYEQATDNATTTHRPSQQQQQQHQFSCLYTKHKTQKKKIWQDGRLILKGFLAVLHSANPAPGSGDPTLDQCELTRPQTNNIQQGHESNLETEKFLITVEGPWARPSVQSLAHKPVGGVSTSMTKVLTKKYKKPGTYVPPHPMQSAQQQPSVLGKRRQPLQPGELQRRHYGSVSQPNYPEPHQGGAYRPPDQQSRHGAPPTTNNGYTHTHTHTPPRQSLHTPPPQSGGYHPGHRQFVPSDHPHGSRQSQGNPYQQEMHTAQPPIHPGHPRHAVPSAHLNGYHQPQHQPQGNPYQQGMHAVQPIPRQPNNVPRPNATPPNDTHHLTDPLQAPPPFHPQPPSSLLPKNQRGDQASSMHRAGPRKERSNIFATGNGFDPCSFYGEDDLEEEDDDDDDDDAAQEDSQFSAGPTLVPARDSFVASDRSNTRNKSPPKARAAAPGPPGAGTTLSTNELLSLFGAAPPPPAEKSPAPADESHQVSDQARAAESKDGAEDDFVLPPSCDSSSDEDD